MLLAFSLLFSNWNQGEVITSTIITAGYGLSIIAIPLVNMIYFLLFIFKRSVLAMIPKWLLFINVLMLIVLSLYIFYLNDPYYNQ